MNPDNKRNSLSREMGPLGAIATVVAGTLGAGLFVTIGTASSTTGPSIILLVALTGIVAMAIATNYSWIATIFPGAGGSYTYISRTFNNRLAGFVVTWSKWLGYMAADAVLAIGFGSYLQVFFPSIDPAIAGFVLLTVLFLINLVGVKGYTRSQNIIFGLLMLSILVLVLPGLFYIKPAHYTPFFTGGASGFTAAAVPLFYAFIGISVAGQMGADMRNPGRNLPLAMAGGTALLIGIYMITALVIYGVVDDYTVLANSDSPLATAADVFLGEYAATIVGIGGLLATLSSVHAVMAAAIKMPYAWSWDGVFPQAFSHVSERFRTPHWSLFLLYIVAAALTFWSDGLDKALAIATFSYLIAYMTVSFTVGYVYLWRRDLATQAAFSPGSWFYISIAIGVFGSALLIFQAANWGALFSGQFGELATLAIYIPWLAIGLVIFAVYARVNKQSNVDIQATLDTLPGVYEEPATR